MGSESLTQPSWIVVGGSQYSCGHCGYGWLDWVYAHPDTTRERKWLACPNCGFDDRNEGESRVESEWYHERYSE